MNLLPYLTAGWPSPAGFLAAARGVREAGCTALEVGIPFTDPVADGPVIQVTSQAALEAGIDWTRSLELMGRVSRETGLELIAMTYTNLLWRQGLGHACQQLAAAGTRGLILPDLPLEEGEPAEKACAEHGIELIYLAAPTTPTERMAELARRTRRFLYLVSLRGVTGARSELPAELADLIRRAREVSTTPVYVGFGISTPEQAAWVAERADGVIVGSALLKHMQGVPEERLEEEVAGFLRRLREPAPA